MPYPTYVLDCPNCGGALQHHVGPSQNTPWLCPSCSRGWWTAELTGEARLAWRPECCDHGATGLETHLRIIDARDQEFAEAHARRTSAREDHLPFLDADQLDALVAFLVPQSAFHPEAKVLMRQATEARKHAPKPVKTKAAG